jgi:hypothetical protein
LAIEKEDSLSGALTHVSRAFAVRSSRFAIEIHAREPDIIYVVSIKSDSEQYPPEGTGFIARNTLIPYLFNAATKKRAIAFTPDSTLLAAPQL